MLTTKEAVMNLRQAIIEESLIQGYWSIRHLGCLLHQLGNGMDIRDPKDCPASLMPNWLAEWVPGAFDGVPADSVYRVAEDFAATLESTVGWKPERWEQLRVDFLCGLIDMAIAAAEPASKDLPCWTDAFNACNRVKDSLRGNGDLDAAAVAATWAAARAVGAAVAATWAARAAAVGTTSAREVAEVAARAAAVGNVEAEARRKQFAMLRRLASV